MSTTYRTLDRGPVEERVKVVLDALVTGKWALMVDMPGNWLVYVHGDQEAPSVGVPEDIINYMIAQNLFSAEKPWRLS